MTTDAIITIIAAAACMALLYASGIALDEFPEGREVTIDTEDGERTVRIVDAPFADEWPAGDPVPADKENLGWVMRGE